MLVNVFIIVAVFKHVPVHLYFLPLCMLRYIKFRATQTLHTLALNFTSRKV